MTRKSLRHYLGPFLLAIIIGVLAGVGAVAFKRLILFGQQELWPPGDNFALQLQVAPWWLLLLIPTAMGLLLGVITSRWAPEVSGPGVPEVVEALSLRGGMMRHRVTLIKTAVTAGFISAGCSLGREGPIVQIGASIGSSLAQFLGLGPEHRRVAVACGAAAGISALFQVPMAGTLFAVEILLYDLEVTSLSNIVIAAVSGTVTARLLMGDARIFTVPAFSWSQPSELLLYFVLGLSAGLLGILLMRIIFTLPRFWESLGMPQWLPPAIAGFLTGCIALAYPQALGIGYHTINMALAGKLTMVVCGMLLGAKLLATGLAMGSGMSGGIFAPSLFMGAMLGTLIGWCGRLLWPEWGIEPAHFALVGMGAMVSATTLAPITAVLTVFELTYTQQVIVPLMVACIAAVMVVRALHGYSIYETRLMQKGINIVKGHEVNILRGLRVGDHMVEDYQKLPVDTPCRGIICLMEESSFPHFIVVDDQGQMAGMLTLRDFRKILGHPNLCDSGVKAFDLMNADIVTVSEDDTMEKAFHLFATGNFASLPVISIHDSARVVGQLRKTDMLTVYEQHVFKKHVLSPLGWACPVPPADKKK